MKINKLYIIAIAIIMVMIIAPASVYAVEDTATQAVRSFLAGVESVYTLTDDITLESDIVVTAGKTIIANDYTITTGEHSFVVRGGSLQLSAITQIEGTLKCEYSEDSNVLLLSDDFTDVVGFLFMSDTLYEVLVDEGAIDRFQERNFVISGNDSSSFVSVIRNGDSTQIVLDDVEAIVVQDTTINDIEINSNSPSSAVIISDDVEFSSNADIIANIVISDDAKYTNTGDGVRINAFYLFDNAEFINKGKTDEGGNDVEITNITAEDKGKITNEGNIKVLYNMKLAKDTTLTNTDNATIELSDGEGLSFELYYAFCGNVDNKGTIFITQTENSDFLISIQKPFISNQLVINDLELLDVSQRKVLSGGTASFYVEDGFLIYTGKSDVLYLYSERENNVTNISVFSNQSFDIDEFGETYFEIVVDANSGNKPIKVELLKANNVLVDEMTEGAVFYNISNYDTYTLLATEDTDEINIATRYLYFEIPDTTKPATAQLKYTFADNKTEILSVTYNLCYSFTKGANQTFEPGKSTALSFKLNGPFDKFEVLEIYGEEYTVEDGLFVVEEGSTVINFTKAGLDLIETFEEGTYDVYAYYADGMTAATELTIGKISNPPTGDNINTYILLVGLTLIGMTTLVLIEKKKARIER